MHSIEKPTQRDRRTISCIRSVILSDAALKEFANKLEITVEQTVIVVRGNVPTAKMRDQIVALVRRAGVLSRVNNCVQVSEQAAA